jgi:hypothetical protein
MKNRTEDEICFWLKEMPWGQRSIFFGITSPLMWQILKMNELGLRLLILKIWITSQSYTVWIKFNDLWFTALLGSLFNGCLHQMLLRKFNSGSYQFNILATFHEIQIKHYQFHKNFSLEKVWYMTYNTDLIRISKWWIFNEMLLKSSHNSNIFISIT